MFKTSTVLVIAILLLCACASKPAHQEAPVSGDEVRVPLSTLKDASPVFYSFSYSPDGKGRVDFFVLRIGGRVESYFDACARCGVKKKGFRMGRGKIICNACGVSYSLDSLKGVGSCYPLPLHGEVRGDAYVIKSEDLLKAKEYF